MAKAPSDEQVVGAAGPVTTEQQLKAELEAERTQASRLTAHIFSLNSEIAAERRTHAEVAATLKVVTESHARLLDDWRKLTAGSHLARRVVFCLKETRGALRKAWRESAGIRWQ